MTEFSHAGTLIHGTLRPQDIIPAFMGKLIEIAPARAQEAFRKFTVDMLDCDNVDEVADEWVSSLADTLNECAPEGWYFGTLEGDGSDFGFWRDESIGELGGWSNDA